MNKLVRHSRFAADFLRHESLPAAVSRFILARLAKARNFLHAREAALGSLDEIVVNQQRKPAVVFEGVR